MNLSLPTDTPRAFATEQDMKAMLAVLFLAAAVIPTLPQRAKQYPPQNRLSLQLGTVTVWLGMPKSEFMTAAKAAGYNVNDRPGLDNEVLMTLESGREITQLYPISFNKAGLLKYASRGWPDTNKSPYEAMLGALKSVDGQHCNISHEPLNTPQENLDRVLVYCDSGRSILITYGKLSISPASFGAVDERIGTE